MKNFRQGIVGFVMLCLSSVAGTSFAQVALTPGSSAGAGFATSIDPNATLFGLVGPLSDSFTATPPNFSGNVLSWAFHDTANPYGSSAWSFAYGFFNDSSSNDAIMRMTVNGFGGYLTTVYTTDCCGFGSLDPTTVSRSGSGGSVSVDWAGTTGVLAGTWSQALIVYTNASIYGTSVASFLDGGIAQADVYAPVPEPETYAMLLAGLGLMGFVARRRQRKLAAA